MSGKEYSKNAESLSSNDADNYFKDAKTNSLKLQTQKNGSAPDKNTVIYNGPIINRGPLYRSQLSRLDEQINDIIYLGKKEDLSEYDLDKINRGQQNKHIVGTHEYSQREEKSNFPPSRIELSDEEIIQFVKDNTGKGINLYNRHGDWRHQEIIVSSDLIVGTVVNNINGAEQKTSVVKIHYSEKGVHIVPDYMSKKEVYT